jgi:hypothetical protein
VLLPTFQIIKYDERKFEVKLPGQTCISDLIKANYTTECERQTVLVATLDTQVRHAE